jgi:type II secretory pathway component GspD/PulD (secretin)
LRSAKADLGTSIMAAPTVTSLNGQSAVVRIGQIERFITSFNVKTVGGELVFFPKCEEYEMGVQLTIEPTIWENGKVHMSVSGAVREHAVLPVPMTPLTTVVQPVKEKGKNGEPVPFTQYIQEPKIMTRTVADTVAIPDGGSVVFYGGSGTIEETVKERLPMLSDVPVLADMFAKDKKTTTTNHLLVVTTVHVIRPDSDVEPCAACCPEGKLAKLMTHYKRACHEGKADEARRLAIECLAIDATCFGAK